MSFKFGLNVKKAAAGKKKSLFGEEDEPTNEKKMGANNAQDISEFNFDVSLDNPSEPAKPAPRKGKKHQLSEPPTRKPISKDGDPTLTGYSASVLEAERRAKEAAEADATIYDYDAAYDALHAQKSARAAAEKEDADQRKPKYMDNLFKSAEQRKKDQLRARDKLLQREREAEGDEFADKDKFVTGAYKAQQEEARKAEEEEQKRSEAEEEQKRKFGMQGFHKQMLMEEEKRHQEAMEAAAQALKDGVKPIVEEEDKGKSDAQLAEELRKQGKTVVLNEEGEVADKRQLLSAGLNIIAKPKLKPTIVVHPSHSSGPQSLSLGSSKPGRDAQRHRQTQMIAEQIEQANKRKAEEEAEELAKLYRASKSQKTATDISSAKERYLQRKKEAAAAKAAASGK